MSFRANTSRNVALKYIGKEIRKNVCDKSELVKFFDSHQPKSYKLKLPSSKQPGRLQLRAPAGSNRWRLPVSATSPNTSNEDEDLVEQRDPTTPNSEPFTYEQIKEAKDRLLKVLKSGSKIEAVIAQMAADGEIDESLLYVMDRRLKAGIEMNQEVETIEGMKLIYYRLQKEFMDQRASPAIKLLEEVLQVLLEDGEIKAKAKLADYFRGLGESDLEDEERVLDIFAMAQQLSALQVEEKVEGEQEVTREEFIKEAKGLLRAVERTGSEEQDDIIQRVEMLIDFVKNDLGQ